MKRIILGSALFFFALATMAQVNMPQPSPTQTVSQNFGMGKISLTYSRPSIKGRVIYGDLVPFGKVWRTGANAATLITFSDPVMVNGQKVDTGTYALYTIPGKDNWELILNKGKKNWGVDGYSEADDVLHTKVSPKKINDKVESFTMQFSNVKSESCSLDLIWENTIVSFPITTNIIEPLRKQIETGLNSDKKPYWQAAQFYNEYDKNLPKALEYATKATEKSPEAYWIWLYKARIEKEMGDNKAATASAQKSLSLAKEDKNDDYVKMNEALLKELK